MLNYYLHTPGESFVKVNIYPEFLLISFANECKSALTNERTDDLPLHNIVNAFVLILPSEVPRGQNEAFNLNALHRFFFFF